MERVSAKFDARRAMPLLSELASKKGHNCGDGTTCHRAWHFWGSGITLWTGFVEELSGSDDAYEVDRFQIRIQEA